MRPEVNLNRFEISNRFEMLFRLHDNLHKDFTAASFQTIARLKSIFLVIFRILLLSLNYLFLTIPLF